MCLYKFCHQFQNTLTVQLLNVASMAHWWSIYLNLQIGGHRFRLQLRHVEKCTYP